MIRRQILLLIFTCCPLLACAETWDYITTSGEYYFGVGHGETEQEADDAALAALVGQIATHVSNGFTLIDDETNTNGTIDHKSRVQRCVKTYSQATLTNTQRWPAEGAEGKAPNLTVRRYMKRSELQRIYQGRIERALDMIERGDE